MSATKKAFSLVEILLAIFLFSIFSFSVVYLSVDVLKRDSKVQADNEGLRYAEEGLEAARSIRDRNFLLLETGDFGLTFSADQWNFTSAPETVDSYYSRTITVEDVYRDGSGEIVETGTLDPMIKKVSSTVEWSWKGINPQSAVLTSYLSNWADDEWMQTTCTEFDTGDFNDTETMDTAAPPADNCALRLLLMEGQSPFFESVDVGDHGRDLVVDGSYAYLVTGKAKTGLVIADISDPDNPTVISQLDIGGKGRYVTKSGNYLYIGVEASSNGLAVVNVSNPVSPSLTTQKNIGGYGNQPTVSGTTLFMGIEKSSNSFVAYDISTPGNPASLGSYNPGEATNVVHLYGNYALLGTADSDNGLVVVNISDPSSMTLVSSLDLGDEVSAIEVSSSVAYVGIEDSGDSLKVVDLSTIGSPSLSTSKDVNGAIQDLKVEGDYLYSPTDEANYSLVVLNVSIPLSPSVSYYADITGKGTGVDTTEDNVFLSLDTNNRGLVLIGTTEVHVSGAGYYTSPALDTGSVDTRYDFIEWEAVVPPTGSISFQIRTADTEAHLNSATWVGSDGTSSSTYTTSPTFIVLDPSRSGNRFVQVRATMTSDGVSSPYIESFSIHYTP